MVWTIVNALHWQGLDPSLIAAKPMVCQLAQQAKLCVNLYSLPARLQSKGER